MGFTPEDYSMFVDYKKSKTISKEEHLNFFLICMFAEVSKIAQKYMLINAQEKDRKFFYESATELTSDEKTEVFLSLGNIMFFAEAIASEHGSSLLDAANCNLIKLGYRGPFTEERFKNDEASKKQEHSEESDPKSNLGKKYKDILAGTYTPIKTYREYEEFICNFDKKNNASYHSQQLFTEVAELIECISSNDKLATIQEIGDIIAYTTFIGRLIVDYDPTIIQENGVLEHILKDNYRITREIYPNEFDKREYFSRISSHFIVPRDVNVSAACVSAMASKYPDITFSEYQKEVERTKINCDNKTTFLEHSFIKSSLKIITLTDSKEYYKKYGRELATKVLLRNEIGDALYFLTAIATENKFDINDIFLSNPDKETNTGNNNLGSNNFLINAGAVVNYLNKDKDPSMVASALSNYFTSLFQTCEDLNNDMPEAHKDFYNLNNIMGSNVEKISVSHSTDLNILTPFDYQGNLPYWQVDKPESQKQQESELQGLDPLLIHCIMQEKEMQQEHLQL
ncbi:MAG TPA: hypothetical protein DEP72_01585 [Clostridiales bacterium]|nr:MAG: hypothetical protein A2Y18_07500 [Clostridiales bacterium GWD2_32_19]HCC06845.1 hypothetical protein [Clostridiales bacterium]